MIGLTTAWAIIKRVDWRILALVVVALVAAIALYKWTERLKESGRAEVRQEWAEAQRRADLKQIALVASQQKKINAADAALAREGAAHVVALSGLETALAAERAKNENKKPASGGTVAVCDAAMPDGVRNALNAIGRTNG